MSKEKQTYNPCDDCQYSYSKNNQESGMCKICEFPYFRDRKQTVGEWVTKGDIFKSYHCSVCNYSVDYPKQKTTYCPECGAKLKGGAE